MRQPPPLHLRRCAPVFALATLLAAPAALAQQTRAAAPLVSIAAPVEEVPSGVSFETALRPGQPTTVLDVDGETCVLPCRLRLPLGAHTVSVPGLFSQRVTLSSPDAVVEYRRADPRRILLGRLLIALGVVPVGVGVAALAVVGALLVNGPGAGLFGTIQRDGLLCLASAGALFAASIAMITLGVLQSANGEHRFTVRSAQARSEARPRFAPGQGFVLDASTGAPVPTLALRF